MPLKRSQFFLLLFGNRRAEHLLRPENTPIQPVSVGRGSVFLFPLPALAFVLDKVIDVFRQIRRISLPEQAFVRQRKLGRSRLCTCLLYTSRIADGYYYAKTIRLLKKLLENPVLLETPANEKVEY